MLSWWKAIGIKQMRWKRLSECPVCGKDRCVVVPIRRNMIFCFRFYRAYWLKKDGSTQLIPEDRQIMEDKRMSKEDNPLFPNDETNYLYDPNNPYYEPKKKEGEKQMTKDKIENNNPRWSRSLAYQFLDVLIKSEIYKNAKLQKVSLSFMSQEYIDKNYLNFIELNIQLTNKAKEEMLVISRFSFLLGKPMGNIVLDEQLCPNKEVLAKIETRLNEIFAKFISSIKEKNV